VIRGDLETDTLKNSSSSTRDGKELWIYQAVELVIIGSWEGGGEPIDENASGTKSRMVYTPWRYESES
jgi:hypothetical protein